MSLAKPRRILAGLGVIVLVIGGYVGWQVYQGQQMTNQYVANAQKLAQTPSSKGTKPSAGASSNSTSLSQVTPAPSSSTPLDSSSNPSGQFPSSTGSSGNSSTPSSPSSSPSPSSSSPSGTPSSGDYKQSMTKTYQQTLQTMQNVKSVTLALQGKNLSLSAYRSSILQSQATFSSAEEFARANPPTDEKLNSSYQEFLAGISLAKESMGVVLNGISSFSPSSLYAAREMGKKAQQQVIAGYSHF